MERYLIELTHSDEHAACIRALEATERHGGNFVRSIDWGCKAGIHSGWMVIEVDNHQQALRVVPPEFREEVRIVKLNRFSKEQITAWMAEQEDRE